MTTTEVSAPARSGFRIWLCGWLLAVCFVLWHGWAVDRYLDRVSATQFTAEPSPTPLQRIPQYFAPDGQMWIRETLDLVEKGQLRLRNSTLDHAPEGRPVYWNSGWAWWLTGCARVRMLFTGETWPVALENAAIWAHVPLMIAVLTLASLCVARRWGGWAGAMMAVGLAGVRMFYGAFYPAYPDHHGLIAACVLGLVLGVAMAGAGWRKRPEDPEFSFLPNSDPAVMRAMTWSAICGAAGMWVSAASLVPVIAFTGVAGFVVACRPGKAADGYGVAVAHAWRRWGRVGALASIGFYLLENFPDRMGLRLEVNHPLYALAWWGAGEALSVIGLWRAQQLSFKLMMGRLLGPVLLMACAPVAVGYFGASVFAPLDPFLMRVHASIHEFESLSAAIGRAGWRAWGDTVFVLIAAIPIVGVAWWRRTADGGRLVLMYAGLIALGATLQGVWQNRWLLTAGGPVVLLVSVCVGRAMIGRTWAKVVLAVLAVSMCAAGPWILIRERLQVERVRDVQIGETVQLLYRDIAATLIREGAGARSIVLSDPNASVGVGYYGRLKTVGTLYWENGSGLREASEILCARDDAQAAALVYARGITHVVLVSRNDFLAEYAYALGGDRTAPAGAHGLGHRVLYEDRIPVWLRPLDYAVPAPLVPLGFKVVVLAVDFETPVAIAHQRIGLYQLMRGKTTLASTSFMSAMAADPTVATPWLLQGRLLLVEGRAQEALTFIRAGIARSPESEQPELMRAAAALFYRSGAADIAETFLKSSGGVATPQ